MSWYLQNCDRVLSLYFSWSFCVFGRISPPPRSTPTDTLVPYAMLFRCRGGHRELQCRRGAWRRADHARYGAGGAREGRIDRNSVDFARDGAEPAFFVDFGCRAGRGRTRRGPARRTEETRVGEGGVSTCKSRVSSCLEQKTSQRITAYADR